MLARRRSSTAALCLRTVCVEQLSSISAAPVDLRSGQPTEHGEDLVQQLGNDEQEDKDAELLVLEALQSVVCFEEGESDQKCATNGEESFGVDVCR